MLWITEQRIRTCRSTLNVYARRLCEYSVCARALTYTHTGYSTAILLNISDAIVSSCYLFYRIVLCYFFYKLERGDEKMHVRTGSVLLYTVRAWLVLVSIYIYIHIHIYIFKIIEGHIYIYLFANSFYLSFSFK